MEKLKKLILTILPGLFLIGFTIGTGSVTAMAKAGADYGMALLWTIGLSCLITYFLINIYGKFAIVTGQTALEAFKKHIHPSVGIFFVVALTISVSGSVIGVMGIIADISFEMSKYLVPEGIDSLYFSIFYIAVVYLLFLKGEFEFFQKALAIIVAIMGVCFLFNFFYLMPSVVDLAAGLIPRIPDEISDRNDTPVLVIASMVGTTVFSGLFIIRTTQIKEAGWKLKDMGVQKRDAIFAAGLIFIISLSIMASAAGTLYAAGINLDNVSQMINLLEPLAGPLATIIFGFGIIAAGVSSQFPNIILFPLLLKDYKEQDLNIKSLWIRLVVLGISLLGLIVPIFNAPPVLVMIITQVFSALLLPFTVLCIFYLGNNKELMKAHAFSFQTNAIMSLILAFALFMSFNGIKGIFSLF